MAHWKDFFGKAATTIEDGWDELRSNLTKKLRLNDAVQIIPYRTYGTARRLYIKGRVLEDKKIVSAGDKDTVLNNLLNMYIRFDSDEVPGATLRVKLQDEVSQSLTEHKIEMILVENTVEAAEHAARAGLIFTQAIPAIKQDKKEDKGQQPGKEDASVMSK